MKKLILYLFSLLFVICFSCKKKTKSITNNDRLSISLKNSNKDTISLNTTSLKQYKNNTYTFLDTLKQLSLPIGNKLLLTDFPEKWHFDLEQPEENKYEAITTSLYKFTDSLLYYTKYKIAIDSSNCHLFPANKYYKYYDNYVFYNYDRDIKTSASVSVAKLANQIKGVDIFFEIEAKPENSSFINIKTIDKNQKEIDGLNIGYTKNVFTFTHTGKYFYIDKNMIIHIKVFLSIDDTTIQTYTEKFQILPSGKIVRYFNEDGEFKTDSEIGKVKNHTQAEKWIEIKENNYIRDVTYLIANYKDGKPIGNWQYFNIINNDKKGTKLLMTEEYSNDGKLLKRELFEND